MPLELAPPDAEILRQKAKPIPYHQIKTKEIQNFIEELGETLLNAQALGLAAPQISKPLRAFAIRLPPFETAIIEYVINPVITEKSTDMNAAWEECLSLPKVSALVSRHDKVVLQYTDVHGEFKTMPATGLLARIIQHECDHLDGRLITDAALKVLEKK
jgi:peptide deformylase